MAKDTDTFFRRLPVGSIVPEGWLGRQIEIVNALQKRMGADTALLSGEAWKSGEIFPRYVRGLILLAGALGEPQLRAKADGYMHAVFDAAGEGGDFLPADIDGTAPKTEAVKTLLAYYELTGDDKAIATLRKFFKYRFNTLSVTHPWYHARARLLDEVAAMDAVYRTGDFEWLKDLAEALRDKSPDWFRLAVRFPYKKAAEKCISPSAVKKALKVIENAEHPRETKRPKPFTPEKTEAEWKSPAHQFLVETDAVNLAKAVKYPCTYGAFMGDKELRKLSLRLIANLDKFHGNATGMFAADRRLGGTSPARGVDVEAAVEMMESLVTVLEHTGECVCADMLEQIAYNVVGAAAFDDASAVEDIVMVNQLECSVRRKEFFSEYPFGNAFARGGITRGGVALLSAYPLFMRALCMTRGADELNFFAYAPCTIETEVRGAKLRIKEETGYPFRNSVVFKVTEADGDVDVRINFRVPRYTTMQLISGGQTVASGTGLISVKCTLRTGSTFMLRLDIPLTAVTNRDSSLSFVKGSVLMASRLGFETSAKNCPAGGATEVNAVKKWSFSPVVAKKSSGGRRTLYDNEQTIVNKMPEKPFDRDNPPFELRFQCKNVLNWDFDINGFSAIPQTPKFSEEALERAFVPFGCTSVRVAQFPPCYRG